MFNPSLSKYRITDLFPQLVKYEVLKTSDFKTYCKTTVIKTSGFGERIHT